MIDVIVVGAGPAGSVAALILARAGARVCVMERESMPRPKLCGDTLNPGAVATLARLGLEGGPLTTAVKLQGMLVTGPRVAVRALYESGQVALSVSRVALDDWLAQAAVAAGARLECGARVHGPLWRGEAGPPTIAGVEFSREGKTVRMPATITIAADGRESVLARAAKLSRHPLKPRRWAFGVHATDVAGMSDVGEMHLRPGHYVGLAPVGGGVTNVCVVTGRRPDGRTPEEVIRRLLNADPQLRERTAAFRLTGPPRVLGPLAVDCDAPGIPGLLLAGDAAGFVDPLTGDGTHLAIRGGVLAAAAALEALETGDLVAAVSRLAAARGDELGAKLRFNRWMRRLSSSIAAMQVVGLGGHLAPSVLRRMVAYAGDTP
ncbi:MAG: NAD(P)/FAD-dependent oxidoreductase [Vicinamibacterales bacterium]